MSRCYEMSITVKGCLKEKYQSIVEVVTNQWGVEDWIRDPEGHLEIYCGEGSLAGGESEEQFVDRVTHAIWDSVGDCAVSVVCTFLEDPPTNYYEKGSEDYKEYVKGRVTVLDD